MGKWLDRLLAMEAERFSAPLPPGHCQNRQNSLLTVLAVGVEGATREIRRADDDCKAARLASLRRWGWSEDEADALAERLAIRDRGNTAGDLDDRVTCAECANYRPGRCGNHRRAGLFTHELGRDLAALLQRCPGFNEH